MSQRTSVARSFAADETGAIFTEYALLCLLIGLACIGVVTVIGLGVLRFFTSVPHMG
jgi:Flp pilus assembly pilin Flp